MATPVRSAITGVSMYFPERVVTNSDLEKMVDTSDEWIRTRTGITERRWVKPGQGASDLAVPAVQNLLKKANCAPEEIDLIIVSTVTPDMMYPSTACLVQNRIGAKNAWGFDLSAGCAGFVFALEVGDQFIRSGKHQKVLLIGADIMSSIINMEDRNTCVLFGDGAGVALLQPTPEATELGILDTLGHVDGAGGEFLYQPAGGSRAPASPETLEKKMHYVHQEGRQVFKTAVTEMANVSEAILERNGFKAEDVDVFIAHQANMRIIESVQKKMGLPDEKVVVNIDKYTNTTCATVPSCLATAVADGRLKKGKLLLITGFGAGYSWGATLVRWAY